MPGYQGRNGRGPQRRAALAPRRRVRAHLLARAPPAAPPEPQAPQHPARGALLLASIIALLLATVAFTGQQILVSQCNLHDLRPLSLGENSFLYTDDGQLLGVVPSATNRQPLPLSKISPWLPQATVAIEDARFWQHGALDYRGILRALYQTSRRATSCRAARRSPRSSCGTSTSATRSAPCRGRSGRPASPRSSSSSTRGSRSSPTISNEVFYGSHAYGAQAAAQTYFSKPRFEAVARPGGAARRPAAGADDVRPLSTIRLRHWLGVTRCCRRCGRTAISPPRSCGAR